MTPLSEDLIDELYATVGFRMTRIRRARGLTQDDVASAAGVARTSVTNAESGRQRMPLHVLVAVAQAMNVTVADLLNTGRPLPQLADPLPPAVRAALASAARSAQLAAATLENAAQALEPFIAGGEPA